MEKKIPKKVQYKVKKPIKIQYASPQEVSAATEEVLRQHARAFALLSKS
ncbi:MAG: hypothetical protein JO313_15635 [Verrucomicrobia bacterium]|nr:hypothetical protein [Verrucomicrobiota bacterium]